VIHLIVEGGSMDSGNNGLNLDLLIELRMSVIILIIEGVDLGRGFTQGLMYTMER